MCGGDRRATAGAAPRPRHRDGRQRPPRRRNQRRPGPPGQRRRHRSVPTRSPRFPLVERVLGQRRTKASVLLRGGFQADLRLVAPEQRGAALQYFTGSKAHNIALRDRALERGWKLNEYGLFDASDDSRSPAPPKSRSTRRSAWRASSRSCARTAARSTPPRPGALPALIDARATSRATCTCTRPRPTAAKRSRQWSRPPRPAASNTSPSPITPSRWRWPTASTRPRARACRAHSRYSNAPKRASPCWPASNATSWPTARWISPTTAWPRSTSSSPRCTRR